MAPESDCGAKPFFGPFQHFQACCHFTRDTYYLETGKIFIGVFNHLSTSASPIHSLISNSRLKC